jgi:hypothetical protein
VEKEWKKRKPKRKWTNSMANIARGSGVFPHTMLAIELGMSMMTSP